MKKYQDGDRFTYKGYIIWCFDGYFDVHEEVDAHPIGEGFATVAEAKNFINEEIDTIRWIKNFEKANFSFNFEGGK